ncbi:hypothetical protein RhiirC2_794445 [Rhizophagus irregularis]|uniref:Uncharacterized protein n=1 Tax=Rhizophagus irregularis TaxID=588596 RepID=A0A2N1MDR4_9GLOM|nr:hypothetical protein RhiirC2_794445 [Rhizophagus irregularis]
MLNAMCQQFGITHRLSTPYYLKQMAWWKDLTAPYLTGKVIDDRQQAIENINRSQRRQAQRHDIQIKEHRYQIGYKKDFDICRQAIQRPIDNSIQRLNQHPKTFGNILSSRRNLNVARMDEARLSSDRTTLGERVAKDVKKIARRAYELFTARGV